MKQSFLFPLVMLFSALFAGCSTTHQAPTRSTQLVHPTGTQRFDNSAFQQTLNKSITSDGLVNYSALKKDSHELDNYYSEIAHISPDSHPSLFPTPEAKLAYWLNAYNATALWTALHYYPISSVAEVKRPFVFSFLPEVSGFFVFQKLYYGQKKINLYDLENKVIRKRFPDPRIHFALNCASWSCPELPRQPFEPETLEWELDQLTRKFINDKKHVHFDTQNNILHLSSIFDWYKKDFTQWPTQEKAEGETTLTDYILLYLDPPMSTALKANKASVTIQYIPYDWRLNDPKNR